MRNRKTWQAGRKASAPPATPGYGTEDQDHPAHQKPPRVPKEASLRAAVEKKAAKCMAIATHMLGKTASSQMIEDQALDLLDMPDAQLDATFARFGGDFFGFDEMLDEEVIEDEAFPVEDEGLEELLAQDEEVMVEETMSPAMAMFDEMDTDSDGFITADDWTGSKAVFASIDTDGDGIVAREEVVAAFGGKKVQADQDITAEERKMLAEMEAEAAKKSEDEDEEAEEDSDKEASDKDAGCEKLPEGPMRDNCEGKKDEGKKDEGKKEEKKAADDEEESEEDEPKKEACTLDPMGLDDGEILEDDIDDALIDEVFGTKAAAKKSDDDEDDSDEEEVEEEVEVEEDDDGDDKEAKKKASERPQRPKKATGPKTVGNMTRTASGELADLENLWESAPDVSGVFNS